MSQDLPLLYTFRRCPFAIRARLALSVSHISYQAQEVILRNKPEAMLAASPKGTVPVMVMNDGSVLEESLDIMLWALNQYDPESWLAPDESLGGLDVALELISENDFEFKPWLDRYKYFERYPEHDKSYYLEQSENFLARLETLLNGNTYLLGNHISLADIAVFPFIRQFANSDRDWFDHCQYIALRRWLETLLATDRFIEVMKKRPDLSLVTDQV